MLNLRKIQNKLNNEGICIVDNFLSEKKCNEYVNLLKKILANRIKKKEYVGQKNSIILYNFFLEDRRLLKLIYNEDIDKVLKKTIDEDYVLTTATARNQYLSNLDNVNLKNSNTSGQKWHTDNRYINNQAIKPSLSYLVIFVLEDFTKDNGSTFYVKRSHKQKKKTKINKNSKINILTAKKGSVIFMDSNLNHKAGIPSKNSRWSIFNIYSPWFVKPYFQFNKLNYKMKLNKKLKKILHFNSTPPLNYNYGIKTLIKEKT